VTALERFRSDPELTLDLGERGHVVNFDLTRSGAVLAWEHFHPETDLPRLLAYVQDQDLWQWQLPNSDAVNAAIGIYPRRFEVWDRLAAEPIESSSRRAGRSCARSAPRSRRALQKCALGDGGEFAPRSGERALPAIVDRSRVGEAKGVRKPVRASSTGLTERRVDCSRLLDRRLRRRPPRRQLRRRGHRNAAGFSISLEEWLARFV